MTTPDTDIRDVLAELVAQTGVAAYTVEGSEERTYGYSVGLSSVHQPELILPGHDLATAAWVVTAVAQAVLSGQLALAGTAPRRVTFAHSGTTVWLLPAQADLAVTHLHAAAYWARRHGNALDVRVLALEDDLGRPRWHPQSLLRTLPGRGLYAARPTTVPPVEVLAPVTATDAALRRRQPLSS